MRRVGDAVRSCLVRSAGAAGVLLIGCGVGLPEGKPWTVDATAWERSGACPDAPCRLDGYRSRDFTPDAALPAAVSHGDDVTVHCFAPPPSPQRDPSGRDVVRWYLVTTRDQTLWAPDVVLTSEADLRRSPDEAGDHLAAGLRACHSAVPGR